KNRLYAYMCIVLSLMSFCPMSDQIKGIKYFAHRNSDRTKDPCPGVKNIVFRIEISYSFIYDLALLNDPPQDRIKVYKQRDRLRSVGHCFYSVGYHYLGVG